jgi:hypothetical protein
LSQNGYGANTIAKSGQETQSIGVLIFVVERSDQTLGGMIGVGRVLLLDRIGASRAL